MTFLIAKRIPHSLAMAMRFEHKIEPVARIACYVCAVFAAFTYMYFISASVVHVIARKEANAGSVRTSAAIATLEREYAALTRAVRAELAEEYTLRPVSEKHFVTRDATLGQSGGALQPLR